MYYNKNGDNMKVLCIGNAAFDITTPVDQYPIENSKNRVQERIECGGGPAGNAAYLLGKWGIDTYFAGVVGNDYYGNQIIKEYQEVNVNIDYLEVRDDHITPSSYIICNRINGSRTILTYRPNSLNMNVVDINIKPDIILLDGQEYEMSKKVLTDNPHAISIIDAGRDKKEVVALCYMVDYVVCSLAFSEAVSHIKIIDNDSLSKALKYLTNTFHNKVIITLEDKGCAYYENNKMIIIPTIKVKTVDSTGAGDIFHGAFVYGLTKKWPLSKILRFANIAGAMSVTRIGGRNSIFTLQEMEEVFNEFE